MFSLMLIINVKKPLDANLLNTPYRTIFCKKGECAEVLELQLSFFRGRKSNSTLSQNNLIPLIKPLKEISKIKLVESFK